MQKNHYGENMLDIALELTFPASDPVAIGFDPLPEQAAQRP